MRPNACALVHHVHRAHRAGGTVCAPCFSFPGVRVLHGSISVRHEMQIENCQDAAHFFWCHDLGGGGGGSLEKLYGGKWREGARASEPLGSFGCGRA